MKNQPKDSNTIHAQTKAVDCESTFAEHYSKKNLSHLEPSFFHLSKQTLGKCYPKIQQHS